MDKIRATKLTIFSVIRLNRVPGTTGEGTRHTNLYGKK